MESKSIDLYGINVQEVYNLLDKKRQTEKHMSSSQFLSLKKKYDEDEQNKRKRSQEMKREQNETSMFLS